MVIDLEQAEYIVEESVGAVNICAILTVDTQVNVIVSLVTLDGSAQGMQISDSDHRWLLLYNCDPLSCIRWSGL